MQTELKRSRFEIYLEGKPAGPADNLSIRCEEEGISEVNFRYLF